MGIYLDSANPADAERAQKLMFVEGITTNPTLMARTGRPGLDVLGDLVEIFDGHVFYQVIAPSVEGRFDEAWQAHEIRPDRVVIKIPATAENFTLAARLEDAGIECAITAVYSPAQAYLSAQVEAAFVIPYVNRMTRQLGDGLAILRDIVQVVNGSQTEVLAASLKSVEEITGTLLAGAHHITLPLDLILAMGEHERSREAIAEFEASMKSS